jgi:hypothetical protein
MAPEFPEMSPVDAALLWQAARLIYRSERTANADAAVRLASEARRQLEGLRKRMPQVARDGSPTLEEWIAARAAKKAGEAAQDASEGAAPTEGAAP